jgi:hypothetical protein
VGLPPAATAHPAPTGRTVPFRRGRSRGPHRSIAVRPRLCLGCAVELALRMFYVFGRVFVWSRIAHRGPWLVPSAGRCQTACRCPLGLLLVCLFPSIACGVSCVVACLLLLLPFASALSARQTSLSCFSHPLWCVCRVISYLYLCRSCSIS